MTICQREFGESSSGASIHILVWDYDQVRIGGIQRRPVLGKVHLHDIFFARFQAETAHLDEHVGAPFATIYFGNGTPVHDAPTLTHRPVGPEYSIVLSAIPLIERP